VDIIVLSISSTLTSGSLVIQRQVKSLRRHIYAESELEPTFHFALLIIIAFVGCFTIFTFILRGLSGPACDKGVDPGDTAAAGIVVLCLGVIVFSFWMLSLWLFRYFRDLASPLFSVFAMALGATGEGQLDSGTVEFTRDVIDINSNRLA
jgi:O-antigen/teichoic acid export membrane protein